MTTDDEKLTFAKLRQRAGFTQRQLADVLGIAVGTISDWERGINEPRPSFAQTKRIMDVLHCTIDELVEATRVFSDRHEQNALK